MRRVLVFLLILTLPVGLMGWTCGFMTEAQDDVDITPILTAGDPSVMEGHGVTMDIRCGDHMYWQTEFTPGSDARTEYTFVQKRQYEGNWDNNFVLYINGNASASTSGSFELGDQGMGKLVGAVADQTQPGQTFTTTVLIEDYMDCYELCYEAYIRTDSLVIDERCDGFLEQDSWYLEYQDVYEQWTELFQFPVIPGHRMEVSVTKDLAGNIQYISYDYVDGAPDASIYGWAGEEGVYLFPRYTDLSDQTLDTGNFPEGNGIYFIGYKEESTGNLIYNGRSYTRATFDFDSLRLVCPLEPEDRILSMEQEGSLAHLIMDRGDRFVYTRLDLETGEFDGELDIGTEYSSNFQFFPEQGVYLLNGMDTITLLNVRGEPRVELSVPLTEEIRDRSYDDLVWEDGKLYLTARDWHTNGEKLVLLMCDREEIRFYGEYQWDEWQEYEYVYGMKPDLYQVRFSN